MDERKRPINRYALFMVAYYTTNAVFQGFISLYYKSFGYTDAQVGLLSSALAVVSVFSMQLWGALGDRLKSRNRLLMALALLAGAVIALFPVARTFWPLLMLVALFSVFYTSIQPMGDSIILEALDREKRAFGPIRMCGGIAFALMSAVAGWFLHADGRENAIVYTAAVLCAVTAVSVLALPPTPGRQSVTGRKMGVLTLLRNRRLMGLFGLMTVLQAAMGYFYTFFSPHFISLPDGNETILGWCYFLSAMSEIPFLLNSDRLFRRLGAGRLMLISALVLTARWIILGLSDSVIVVMASQLLHGWGFIVITVSMSKYISRTVPPELRATGQLLMSVFGFGLARIVGYFGGGVLSDALGRQTVFLLCAGLCALAFCIYAPLYLRTVPLNGEDAGA